MIGHLLGAAGAVEAIAAIQVMLSVDFTDLKYLARNHPNHPFPFPPKKGSINMYVVLDV